MKEECLVCKAPLVYLQKDELMECVLCHKRENSKTKCVNGHYICNECHMEGMDAMIGICLEEKSKDPIEIIEKMMRQPFCHMHGPEHHVMVGSALLTAYRNAGGDMDLKAALIEMHSRGKSVPGGACSHLMTSQSLERIGRIGGSRCCKRDSFLSILSAIDFVEEHFGVSMESHEVICGYGAQNNQCLGKKCPFSKGNHK